MYYWEDSDANLITKGDGVDYKSSVRARATETLNELKHLMKTEGGRVDPHPESLHQTVHPRYLAFDGQFTDHPSQTPRLAASGTGNKNASLKLKELLSQQSSPVKIQTGTEYDTLPSRVPSVEEAGRMLQSHVNHSQQLEMENNYLKEEMRAIKAKVIELLQENEQLHRELRSSMLQEILHEGVTLCGDQKKGALTDEVFEEITAKSVLSKWKTELARLHELHDAKAAHLEAQLASAKTEVSRYERVVDELRAQLRMQNSNVATHEDGSIDGLEGGSHHTMQRQTIASLQRERDELTNTVTSLRVKMRESADREEMAYQQVKKGIELVEQAQLEQTEALVAKEQLQSQLEKTQQRFQEYTDDMTRKLGKERETTRDENKALVTQLNEKIREVVEQQAATQHKLEKVTRDKKSVVKTLEECKGEMKLMRRDAIQMSVSQKTENANCTLLRQQSQQEVVRLRADLSQVHKDIDQERSRLRVEREELNRRLEHAERDVVNAKEECIHLTSQIQSLEKELHLAKMNKESVEVLRKNDINAMIRRSEQREGELNGVIDDMQIKSEKVESEMDDIVNKQNKLIVKLRNECHRQTAQLAKVTQKYRREVGGVKRENEGLRQKLEHCITRVDEANGLNDQHTQVQKKMAERLKVMDEHGQRQAQQILDLLNKQGEMMKQRQTLAKEIGLLRSKLLSHPQGDQLVSCNKPVATSMAAIDDILSSVIHDNTQTIIDQYRPPPSWDVGDISCQTQHRDPS